MKPAKRLKIDTSFNNEKLVNIDTLIDQCLKSDDIPITDHDIINDFSDDTPTVICNSDDLKTAHLAYVGDDSLLLSKYRALSSAEQASVERHIDLLFQAGTRAEAKRAVTTKAHRWESEKHLIKIEVEIPEYLFLVIDERVKAQTTTWTRAVNEAIGCYLGNKTKGG